MADELLQAVRLCKLHAEAGALLQNNDGELLESSIQLPIL
jgi:hypothetical protein